MAALSPRIFWGITLAILAFGLWLRVAIFQYEFSLDDYAQIAMLEGRYPAPRSPLDLYTFSNGAPGDVQALVQHGFYPWFTHPELRLSMLRPLSSALMALDHALFGRDALPYHLHSALWWCAVLGLLAYGLRALFGSRVALIALLLFCVDESQSVALGWIANRNALISIAFALIALHAYRRFREEGSRSAATIACLTFCLALAAGEYALCMAAYALAYELFVARDRLLNRLRALSLWAAPALVFLAVRRLGGFGAAGSDMYLDPFRNPGFFLRHGLVRLPVLLGDVVWGFPSEWWTFGLSGWTLPWIERGLLPPTAAVPDAARALQAAAGALAGILAAALAFAAVRGSADPTERRRLAAVAAGSGAAFLPLLAGFPSTRALLAPLIGYSVVLAALLDQALRPGRQGWVPRTAQVLAGALCLGQLAYGAREAEAGAETLATDANTVRDIVLTAEVDEARLNEQRVILLNSAHPGVPIYFELIRRQYAHASPLAAWSLSTSFLPYLLTRPSDRALELQPLGGKLVSATFERVFRTGEAPIRPEQKFVLRGMTVTALAADSGGISRLRAEFDRPLEDPIHQFLIASPTGLSRAVLPAIGQTVLIPAPVFPSRLRTER